MKHLMILKFRVLSSLLVLNCIQNCLKEQRLLTNYMILFKFFKKGTESTKFLVQESFEIKIKISSPFRLLVRI